VEPASEYIAAALADPQRPAADKERDAVRKPAECVAFAGIKRGDRVADVFPGRGYYSRIFSAVVGPQGHVYPVLPQIIASHVPEAVADTKGLFTGYPNVTLIVAPLEGIRAPEPLDVVWVGQVYHDFPNVEMGPADIAAVNKAIFAALKPGGVYIVTDHAAPS